MEGTGESWDEVGKMGGDGDGDTGGGRVRGGGGEGGEGKMGGGGLMGRGGEKGDERGG